MSEEDDTDNNIEIRKRKKSMFKQFLCNIYIYIRIYGHTHAYTLFFVIYTIAYCNCKHVKST